MTTEHDARDAQTPTLEKARDFADRYGLGTHATEDLATALREAADAAHAAGKAEGAAEEREISLDICRKQKQELHDWESNNLNSVDFERARNGITMVETAIRAREGGDSDG